MYGGGEFRASSVLIKSNTIDTEKEKETLKGEGQAAGPTLTQNTVPAVKKNPT